MAGIKSLAKDTAIYGLSSIIGRFLNWCLVPLYTNLFPSDEYGIVTYLYSIVALALIILTYGMETGFFRFANHDRYDNPDEVYSTALCSLGATSSIFFLAVLLFLGPISVALNCPDSTSYIWMMALAVALDAYTALPFAYLRYKRRPMRFAIVRLVNIGLNIGLNIFFLLLCPYLMSHAPAMVNWFYSPTFGIGYIFLSNLIASAVTLLMLLPETTAVPLTFNPTLLHEMLRYSFPILVLGVAGIMNQTIDKIIFPLLDTDTGMMMSQLGIYGANYKIAIVMVMFTQAFRFAYEPFIFARSRDKGDDRRQAYSDAMKYFVIFALFIFLGVMFWLDILKYFISPAYFSGLRVVPIVMIAEICFGIFFNLSIWYKLTDKTVWGMWFSIGGLIITVTLNILLVPRIGYMGCAWAGLACYGSMMLASYFFGRKRYPVDYPVGRLIAYCALTAVIYQAGMAIHTSWTAVNLSFRTILLIVYLIIVIRAEKISVSSILHRR